MSTPPQRVPSPTREHMEDVALSRALDASTKVVENQGKLADAALIAAKAFERLVDIIAKAVERYEK